MATAAAGHLATELLKRDAGIEFLLVTPGTIDDFVRFEKEDMAQSQRIITEAKIRNK